MYYAVTGRRSLVTERPRRRSRDAVDLMREAHVELPIELLSRLLVDRRVRVLHAIVGGRTGRRSGAGARTRTSTSTRTRRRRLLLLLFLLPVCFVLAALLLLFLFGSSCSGAGRAAPSVSRSREQIGSVQVVERRELLGGRGGGQRSGRVRHERVMGHVAVGTGRGVALVTRAVSLSRVCHCPERVAVALQPLHRLAPDGGERVARAHERHDVKKSANDR